jgi:chorismate mutase/prephenate dehydratase
VFENVESGQSDHGIVPAENSIEGTVSQTYDLLLTGNLTIVGETVYPIRHCLLALPGVDAKDVSTVYSHPQALAQCHNYLEKLGVQIVGTYDTAGSAKLIAEQKLRTAAAIAGAVAAEIYGLEVLARDIQDFPENLTRFFVLGIAQSKRSGRDKTSIVFGVKHEPGTLFRAIREFADRKLNLTKIESRPVKGKPWEYHFYVDFEGHRDDEVVKQALKALEKATTYIKVLGSYPQLPDQTKS